jgi:hypothetical protein
MKKFLGAVAPAVYMALHATMPSNVTGDAPFRKHERMLKRERKHAQYRADERARVQAALKARRLSNNVNDKCWDKYEFEWAMGVHAGMRTAHDKIVREYVKKKGFYVPFREAAQACGVV